MIEIVSFDVYIDDTEMTGVEMISLVKKPAIMEDFIAMSDDQTEQYKQVILSEDDKQIITGPALIPDIEIIRKDEDGNPFYIKYSKETIEKIAQKFAKFRGNYQVNKDHKKEKMAEETFIYESWITGENDKALELGFDVPAGTWMVSLKVENSDLWNQIKAGKYKGFSIEGLFKFKRSSRIVKQECDCNRDLEYFQLESYTDYPEAAKNNAKRALEWADKNGWGDCGTPVGKIRANQLANGEPISEDTIARMSAFRRHQQNKDVPYSEGCGGLMWDAWGGDAGINWAENKLKEIRQSVIELAGEPGLIHPNCRCSIRKGEFRLSKPRIGKDGNPVPCEVCKMASESWVSKGFIEDVFGTKYENTKQEEINLGYIDLSKVSFDYDETLTTDKGMELAKKAIENGDDVYIISARSDKEAMLNRAKELGIPESRVIATGSNKAKVEKVKELGIEKHYDNNADVIKELGDLGIKLELVEKNDFDSNITMSEQVALLKPGESENQDEFISRCMGDKTMNSEYPEQNQRAAVCYAYWSEKQEKINVNMVSAILKDGNTIYTDAESMAVGVEVYFMEGESKVSVDNGEYELEDGNIIVVEESKIKEIKDMSQLNEELSNEKGKETKMEIDPMLVEQFDAIKGMLENLNLKIDSLISGENESAGKVDQIETKLEKLLVDSEMKSIEATDDLKKVAQESHSKRKLDYDLITKYNKKF